jgi:hypothetical protein
LSAKSLKGPSTEKRKAADPPKALTTPTKKAKTGMKGKARAIAAVKSVEDSSAPEPIAVEHDDDTDNKSDAVPSTPTHQSARKSKRIPPTKKI